MLRAKSLKDVVDTASRWRDIGGTHVSIVTMGQNFTGIEQHLDYMKRAADAIRAAGLF
jgi:biotin synthase-like enzyme